MKRNGPLIALRALLVESVGVLLLLLLLFPAPDQAAEGRPAASQPNHGQTQQAGSPFSGSRQPPRRLPLLRLLPPPSR